MLEPIDPIESFRPDANARCVCGKKDLFKNCCGSSAVDREIPAEIMIAKSFLPSVTCDKLVKFVSTEADSSDLAVFVSSVNDTSNPQEVVNNDRVTSKIDLKDKQKIVDKWIADIFHKVVAKKTGRKFRNISAPDLMRYMPGGYYKTHSDSELFDVKTGSWNKVLDRDYSLLLYLNDDFEGGGVYFPLFNYTFKPSKGDLLVFPSGHLYLHEAQLVTSGVRYVIVSWAAFK
tara:strand:- start:264 stop:956 length:693 start_codon:yes stop_codon:yes gene_type:complete